MTTRTLAARAALLVGALLVVGACGGAGSGPPPSFVDHARLAAQDSSDPEVIGRWLAAELVAPGGDPKRARLARLRASELGGRGSSASLARGIDADVHGRFSAAAEAYLAALSALRAEAGPDVPVRGWFAANRLVALSTAVRDLWPKARPVVETIVRDPGWLGWRARGELVEWWSRERLQGGTDPVDERVFEEIAARHGCLQEAWLAGPFGVAARSDHRVHYEAERPAPWPARFRPSPRRLEPPERRELEHHGCLLRPKADRPPPGIYYVQSFVELPTERDVVIAVQGAFSIYVDDHEVLTRDSAAWGIWPRFGVHLRLGAGRHRLLARIGAPETSLRVLDSDGRPLGLRGSADDRAPYSLAEPVLLADPNVLEPWLRSVGVPPPAGGPPLGRGPDVDDPVLRYAASYLAHVEGQDDVASVILEPLVKSVDQATAVALAQQAVFVDGDPIFTPAVALDLARDLRRRAIESDPELWGPKLWLTLENTSRLTPRERVTALEELARQFPEVPPVATRLANAYAELGWVPEHARAVEEAAKRFPDHVEVLEALLGVEERRGRRAEADKLAARIRALEPASEIELRRAVARHDWSAAMAELRRISSVRPERQDIARRLEKLQLRAGQRRETLAELERALREEPTDADARLALADTRLASGHGEALSEALADALRTGSETKRLRSAIELVEGTISLEPFRRDGLAVIREAEQSGFSMPGTAARLLDYVALWVEPDGSARMLEHEIIRVQSREGIAKHTEQNVPNGTILRMRTIKRDGTVFEPEIVAGKPTVTMPHLEIGDYVETEYVWLLGGDGKGGRAFLSPRWMFQERNVSYHLSEFVLITPTSQPLQIETTGQVPAPELEQAGALTVRRWRVTGSVGVPDEELSPEAEEYLPSVRAGWGIDLDERLRRLMDTHRDELPLDPRLVRLAAGIVAGNLEGLGPAGEKKATPVDPTGVGVSHGAPSARAPIATTSAASIDERARRLYRWVADNVQPGPEQNGPRIITSKTGDRLLAFIHLCKLAKLDARLGVIQDRLSPEPTGPFSEATKHSVPAARLATEQGPRWLVIADRYAPYGYLPSSLRGQSAVLLDPAIRVMRDEPLPVVTETTSREGSDDRVVHAGDVTLSLDGRAEAKLTQTFHGRYAIEVRSRLAKEPEARWRDVLEAELLGVALPGARIRELSVEHLADLDEPVRLVMQVELPSFARLVDGALEIDAPFLPNLGRLAALQSRQTPLVLPEGLATRALVELRITLPEGARFAGELAPALFEDEGRRAEVADRTEGGRLLLVRSIDLPAGRVAVGDYEAFRDFVQSAGEALHRTVRVPLPGR